jgi:SAM-dependent methyltransferase
LSSTAPLAARDIEDRMERMYRPQRLIYDLTRKYYLLGRDKLIERLDARPGEVLIDIGCGTGRNLEAIARRYPNTRLFGLDVAGVMLETTAGRFAKAGLPAPGLARAAAEDLAPLTQFGIAAAHHLLFSYSLSMMDDRSRHPAARHGPWRRAAGCTSSTSARWTACRGRWPPAFAPGSPGSGSTTARPWPPRSARSPR